MNRSIRIAGVVIGVAAGVLLLNAGGSPPPANAQDSVPRPQIIAHDNISTILHYRDVARKTDCWIARPTNAQDYFPSISCVRDAAALPTRWEWIPGETQWRIRYDP